MATCCPTRNVAPSGDNSTRSSLTHQKCDYRFVNDRRSSVEAYYSLHSGTPNDRGILVCDEINANKKVIGEKSDDSLLPLRGFGQGELWEESIDTSAAEVHFSKLFPLGFGINRAPLFVTLRHLLYMM